MESQQLLCPEPTHPHQVSALFFTFLRLRLPLAFSLLILGLVSCHNSVSHCVHVYIVIPQHRGSGSKSHNRAPKSEDGWLSYIRWHSRKTEGEREQEGEGELISSSILAQQRNKRQGKLIRKAASFSWELSRACRRNRSHTYISKDSKITLSRTSLFVCMIAECLSTFECTLHNGICHSCCCSQELDSKTPLLKITHDLVPGYREDKLEPEWRLPPCWLVHIVPDSAAWAPRGKLSSKVLLKCGVCILCCRWTRW